MQLGIKFSIAILAVTTCTAGLTFILQARESKGMYAQIQRQKALDDLHRSHDAIDREILHLGQQTRDWGSWDDAYSYLGGTNPAFEKINLVTNVFDTTHVDLLYFLDTKGKVVWGRYRTDDGKVGTVLKGFDPKALALGTKSNPGPSLDSRKTFSGVLNVSSSPLIIFGRAVIDNSEHAPTHGTLIMGQFESTSELEQIRKAGRVEFYLADAASEAQLHLPPAMHRALAAAGEAVEEPGIERSVNGYTWLKDIDGHPSYLLTSSTPDDIVKAGHTSLVRFGYNLLLITLVTTSVLLILVRYIIANPLGSLSRCMAKVSEQGDLSIKPEQLTRGDEIGILARSFSQMLDNLQNLRMKFLQASRDAGMSEVARGILHNAGNVMNSVSTSTYQVSRIVERNNDDGLRRLVDLLESQEDLGDFFAHDPKSQHVLSYLKKIHDSGQEVNDELRKEIETLTVNIEHMNKVIESQHSFAQLSESREPVRIETIVNQSIAMLRDAFSRHSIQLESEIDDIETMEIDSNRLLQILVNFLTNARDAVKQNEMNNRRILFSASNDVANQHVRISITDNGFGIADQEMESIFRSGFTTKESGKGHGLHYCATTAMEMGWRIDVTSPGKTLGATFSVSIPFEQKLKKAA